MARRPPISSSTWFAESATEWIASESIELDPVKPHATNFATAMPRFAPSAASTAFVPPSVLMDADPSDHGRAGPAGDATSG